MYLPTGRIYRCELAHRTAMLHSFTIGSPACIERGDCDVQVTKRYTTVSSLWRWFRLIIWSHWKLMCFRDQWIPRTGNCNTKTFAGHADRKDDVTILLVKIPQQFSILMRNLNTFSNHENFMNSVNSGSLLNQKTKLLGADWNFLWRNHKLWNTNQQIKSQTISASFIYGAPV